MTVVEAKVGFELNLNDETRVHNTFTVHQLLHWSHQQGLMHDLEQALFTGYFINN